MAIVTILRMNQQMEDPSVCVCVRVCNSAFHINKSKKENLLYPYAFITNWKLESWNVLIRLIISLVWLSENTEANHLEFG